MADKLNSIPSRLLKNEEINVDLEKKMDNLVQSDCEPESNVADKAITFPELLAVFLTHSVSLPNDVNAPADSFLKRNEMINQSIFRHSVLLYWHKKVTDIYYNRYGTGPWKPENRNSHCSFHNNSKRKGTFSRVWERKLKGYWCTACWPLKWSHSMPLNVTQCRQSSLLSIIIPFIWIIAPFNLRRISEHIPTSLLTRFTAVWRKRVWPI